MVMTALLLMTLTQVQQSVRQVDECTAKTWTLAPRSGERRYGTFKVQAYEDGTIYVLPIRLSFNNRPAMIKDVFIRVKDRELHSQRLETQAMLASNAYGGLVNGNIAIAEFDGLPNGKFEVVIVTAAGKQRSCKLERK